MNDALPVTDDSWMVWDGLIVRLEEHTHYSWKFSVFPTGGVWEKQALVTYLKNMFLEKCLQLGYILTQICNAEGESGLNES